MPAPSEADAAKRLTPLQVATLILSIYVLIALLVQSVFQLPAAADALLDRIDFFVCLVFLADFFARFARAPSKLAFLKWGWIDFVSSIPMLDIFRIGRVVRIVRIFRVLRAFRSTKNLVSYLLRERKTTSLAAVAATSFVLMVFAAIAMLQFETSPDSNIKTPIDAFWWAFVTVTTVGYGDRFPITAEGRIVACVLLTVGVAVFATFTGFVASLLVERTPENAASDQAEVVSELQKLRAQLESLEEMLNQRQ